MARAVRGPSRFFPDGTFLGLPTSSIPHLYEGGGSTAYPSRKLGVPVRPSIPSLSSARWQANA